MDPLNLGNGVRNSSRVIRFEEYRIHRRRERAMFENGLHAEVAMSKLCQVFPFRVDRLLRQVRNRFQRQNMKSTFACISSFRLVVLKYLDIRIDQFYLHYVRSNCFKQPINRRYQSQNRQHVREDAPGDHEPERRALGEGVQSVRGWVLSTPRSTTTCPRVMGSSSSGTRILEMAMKAGMDMTEEVTMFCAGTPR
jgi:hypothetical protein